MTNKEIIENSLACIGFGLCMFIAFGWALQ
jgi:hypothetical protein